MKTFSGVDLYRREFLRLIPDMFLRRFQRVTCRFTAQETLMRTGKAAEGKPRREIALIAANLCIAREGGMCQACYVACPLRDQAIRIEDQLPLILDARCDGCGKCVNACRTVNDHPAIRLVAFAAGERGDLI